MELESDDAAAVVAVPRPAIFPSSFVTARPGTRSLVRFRQQLGSMLVFSLTSR